MGKTGMLKASTLPKLPPVRDLHIVDIFLESSSTDP
jgi:hypothetical protein